MSSLFSNMCLWNVICFIQQLGLDLEFDSLPDSVNFTVTLSGDYIVTPVGGD